MFKLKISSMVEIFWLIPLSGLFWFHSWYSIHYRYTWSPWRHHPLISNPLNHKVALNKMLYRINISNFLWAFNFSLLWDMMGLNLTSDTAMHPEKSSIIALSTHRLSSRTKYYVNFICLWLITVIRSRSCIWCGQRDHKYYQQHGHSLETREDQNHSAINTH